MNIIEINKENISTRGLVSLIVFAYLFSIAIRMIWVYQFSGTDTFIWNNELMINTNDGYFWASGAQAILDNMHQHNPRIPDFLTYGVTFFTVILAKITPLSLNTIILYMPAIVSSIVVVPIILLGRLYGLSIFGFFASLIGSIAWSYYNRTMTGYYDTDMFSAMAPMFILYFLIRIIEKEDLYSVAMASFFIVIYPFLYDSGHSIVFAMGIIYFIYMIIFHRKEDFTYQSILLISIALLKIYFLIKIILLIIVFALIYRGFIKGKQAIYIAALGVVGFFFFGNVFGLIWSKVSSYARVDSQQLGLQFFQVKQTVREAGQIPFSTMANRISGSTIGVIASLIGYILLVIKYRPFILALPLIGIGVFSLWGGLRFTVYAVPVAAISSVFLFYVIASFIQNRITKYSLIIILTLAMLYPNIIHIIQYKVPTVFTKEEVKILDKLKTISTPKDYTLTWWDYGYPIWYYSNTNTLIDGGKHNQDNFIISQILNTDSQRQAANLSRLAVETYVSSGYKIVANEIFKNKQKDQIDPNMMLDELMMDDYKLPQKTRDIFLYLPSRMLNIFPTVGVFSNINLKTGKEKKRPFFYQSQSIKDSGKIIDLGNNIKILQDTGEIQIGTQKVKIANLAITYYDNKGKLQKNIQRLNRNSPISVIYMKNYNKFLIVDKNIYNSLFIQMFVLENYDKELFEAVILNPLAKIYKLKI